MRQEAMIRWSGQQAFGQGSVSESVSGKPSAAGEVSGLLGPSAAGEASGVLGPSAAGEASGLVPAAEAKELTPLDGHI